MILALQIISFLWVCSLFVFGILCFSVAAVDPRDLPDRKVLAMIVFWPLTLVVLSPLIIVYVIKWGGILAGSFSGGIGELYSKAVRR
jgi:hypothetical protein